MAPSDRRSGERTPIARFADALPPGTVAVFVGLVVTGVTSYAFLVISGRTLGAARYGTLSLLWAIIFVAGPGTFLPLQQETARLVAQRRVEGVGNRPVILRSALIGACMLAAAYALVGSLTPVVLWRLLDRQVLLFVAFGCGLLGYFLLSLAWGSLAGAGRFREYALAQSGDGILRLLATVVLAAMAVREVGAYGLVFGAMPAVAALVAFSRNRDLLDDGPVVPWRGLSRALGWLLVGSVTSQALANATIIAVKILASPRDEATVGHFVAGVVVARVPLFFFGAVQAALLPRLAALSKAGKAPELRNGLRTLLLMVALIAAVASLGALLVGPAIVQILFGHQFVIGRVDMLLLAAGNGAYMLALAATQALIGLGRHRRSAIGWVLGVASFGLVVVAHLGLLRRVEVAFLVSAGVVVVSSAILLWPLLHEIEADIDPGALLVSYTQLELEP
ncbi:MAG: lipopolysaccharide biosynthesis protein [Acidimicrobiales bacterium]